MKRLLSLLVICLTYSTFSQNTYVYPTDTLVDPALFESTNLLVNWTESMCPVKVTGTDTVFAPCYLVTFKDHYTASIDLCPVDTNAVGGIGLFNGTPRLLDASLWIDMEADGSNIISNQDGMSVNYKNLTTGVEIDGGGMNPKFCIEADLYNGTSQTWYQEFMILMGPIQKPGPAINYHTAETIGILKNGMCLEHTPPSSESTAAIQGGMIPLDRCGFHPEPAGFGHFHTVPYGINESLEANGIGPQYHCNDIPQLNNTGLAGFTFEGVPIYGPYDQGQTTAPTDLDGCYGHSHSTPDFQNGAYHYHISATDIINNPPCYDYYTPLETERFKYGEWTGGGSTIGTELLQNETLLKVYPNPANSQLTIEGSFTTFELFDTEGRTVLSSNHQASGIFVFDISDLESGTYFLSASNDSDYFFEKIVIQ